MIEYLRKWSVQYLSESTSLTYPRTVTLKTLSEISESSNEEELKNDKEKDVICMLIKKKDCEKKDNSKEFSISLREAKSDGVNTNKEDIYFKKIAKPEAVEIKEEVSLSIMDESDVGVLIVDKSESLNMINEGDVVRIRSINYDFEQE